MNTKQIFYIGGGTAFGAVAAVLLMKSQPADVVTDADQESANEPKISSVNSGGSVEAAKSDRVKSTVLEQIAEANPEVDLAEIESRRDEFRDSMKERQMDRLTSKMAQWSAALGLDEGQQEKMVEMAGLQLDELEGLAQSASESGDPAAIAESAKRAMAIISGRALEDSMGDLLTPEQQKTYEEFGERQTQSRAEATTLRQLAGLQEDLMLTPGQRNDVYAVLYENSLASVKEDSGVGSMIETFASQSGMSIDPSLQGVLSQIASKGLDGLASGQKLDRDSIKEMAAGAASESIEKQVEQLRPVLSAGQLELYRTQLESRVGNLMKLGGSGQ
ncbi:hypothetical protein V2O64_02030 [Verrucomicrobiaceae bacterium 227]